MASQTGSSQPQTNAEEPSFLSQPSPVAGAANAPKKGYAKCGSKKFSRNESKQFILAYCRFNGSLNAMYHDNETKHYFAERQLKFIKQHLTSVKARASAKTANRKATKVRECIIRNLTDSSPIEDVELDTPARLSEKEKLQQEQEEKEFIQSCHSYYCRTAEDFIKYVEKQTCDEKVRRQRIQALVEKRNALYADIQRQKREREEHEDLKTMYLVQSAKRGKMLRIAMVAQVLKVVVLLQELESDL